MRAAFTANTLTDETALLAVLAIARTREEQALDIAGIGRAVVIDGELLEPMSVAIPLAPFDAKLERRVTELLIHATG